MACDKLLATLPHVRWAEPVAGLTTQLLEATMRFLSRHFAAILHSTTFVSFGGELSWNISRLEESLINCSARAPPEQQCQSLKYLIVTLEAENNPSTTTAALFIELLKKLRQSCETGLVRSASRALRCPSWPSLPEEVRLTIQEAACLPPILTQTTTTVAPSTRRSRQTRPMVTSSGSRALDLRRVRQVMHESKSTQQPTLPKPPPPERRKLIAKPLISSSDSSRTSSPAMRRSTVQTNTTIAASKLTTSSNARRKTPSNDSSEAGPSVSTPAAQRRKEQQSNKPTTTTTSLSARRKPLSTDSSKASSKESSTSTPGVARRRDASTEITNKQPQGTRKINVASRTDSGLTNKQRTKQIASTATTRRSLASPSPARPKTATSNTQSTQRKSIGVNSPRPPRKENVANSTNNQQTNIAPQRSGTFLKDDNVTSSSTAVKSITNITTISINTSTITKNKRPL